MYGEVNKMYQKHMELKKKKKKRMKMKIC